MRYFTNLSIILAIVLNAAIFGFFYAWVCSTMWGLDATDPRVAIAAMQAMNASVRNVVFAPAFFATPFALAFASALLWRRSARKSAAFFGTAALVYLIFGLILTMLVNVPMNEALANFAVPPDIAAASEIWLTYSPTWQIWNQIRTIASGIALILAVCGVLTLQQSPPQSSGH
ncbi:MAG: anthrone oxygenase family protein [Pseudomonadota bacterium]